MWIRSSPLHRTKRAVAPILPTAPSASITRASLPVPAAFTTHHPLSIKPQRLLLLQLKRIGDFILTAPAVAALRAAHPQAEIVGIVPDSVAELAACMPGLDRVLSYRSASLNAAVWASLLFGEWDVCYDFTGTDRSALMAWLSRARESLGYAKFASDGWRMRAYTSLCDASVRDLHTVDFHLALVSGNIGMPESDVFAIPSTLVDSVSKINELGRYAVIHIGTAREEKFWPAERWAEMIAHLIHARGMNVVLTGTNAGLERTHLDTLRGLLGQGGLRITRAVDAVSQVLDLTGQLSLVETAQVIAGGALAIGVDSMAMHLAAMLEKPQIVLYGPTNPFHWRPRHRHAIVIVAGQAVASSDFQPKVKGQPMELISTRMVVAAVEGIAREEK